MKPRRSERIAIFRVLAFLLIPLLELLVKFVVVNGDKLPKTGAFVLSPNHMTNIDPVLVGRVMWKLGRAPRFLAKSSLFTIPVVGWVLRKSGQVPVERTGVVRGADPLAAGERIVAQDLAVVVYPEGSLTRDPELWPMRGKFGAIRMAIETGVPLIPAAHWGDQEILPPYRGKFHPFPRHRVTFIFGDPIDLSAYEGKPLDSATLTAATATLMTAIANLLGELRGETPRAERWDPVAHGQSEVGKF